MWVITPDDVGHIVREQRKQLGLSQQELARYAGVTRQWVSMLEKGKPSVELASVLRVLSALGLRVDVRDARQASAPPVSTAALPFPPGVQGPLTESVEATMRRRLATSRSWRAKDPDRGEKPRRKRGGS